RNLAQWCAANKVRLIHLSTDYVFGQEARSTPWLESDPTGPVSAYGASKLAGEHFVRSACSEHVIVRSCGLYRHRGARGTGNFVEHMLRLGLARPELKIRSAPRCTPTSTADLAVALVKLVESNATGTFHATNSGDCSWFEFATEIFRLANLQTRAIPI